MAFKKKLHLYRPGNTPVKVETHRTKEKVRLEVSTPREIERAVRQLLANKVSGTLVGIWLLVPEYLRLGAWDLLKTWTGMADERIEPRLGLQLINESALCVTGIRMQRTLSQKGFELANGLPFVATDAAIHQVLDSHGVAEAQQVQIALGKVRQTFGHFNGKIIIIDPHRIKSSSKRQMIRRQKDQDSRPAKMAQTFFSLDAQTEQPLCFTTASSARTSAQATPELLGLVRSILKPNGSRPLILADNEHYSLELFESISSESCFDLLVPMPYNASVRRAMGKLPSEAFTRRWAGYATAKQPYAMVGSRGDSYFQFIQRKGERQQDYDFKAFLCTSDRDEMQDLSGHYPQRWHIEEFFKTNQALGWHRAGTMNLNIRYGQMTMALIAQTACSMMRQRLGPPVNQWDALHVAKDLFRGLEGDIRVQGGTIVVTYYNAPNPDLLKTHYENMPKILSSEGIKPMIPWLYDFKLDFRFK
jgi:Transposase DDE domain